MVLCITFVKISLIFSPYRRGVDKENKTPAFDGYSEHRAVLL